MAASILAVVCLATLAGIMDGYRRQRAWRDRQRWQLAMYRYGLRARALGEAFQDLGYSAEKATESMKQFGDAIRRAL